MTNQVPANPGLGKLLFIVIAVLLFTKGYSQVQSAPSSVRNSSTVDFHIEMTSPDEVKSICAYFTENFGDRVLVASGDFTSGIITLSFTGEISEETILQVFQQRGYSAYFDRNGKRYHLSMDGSTMGADDIKQ